MTGSNGNGAPGKPAKTGLVIREPDGKFAPGTAPGPGRPTLDILKIARAQADRTGHSLDKVVEIALRALARGAAHGDVGAIKVLLGYLVGPVDKPAQVNVAVDARTTVEAGPPMPSDGEFGAYAIKLLEVTKAQGLLPEPLDPETEALLA